SPAPFRPALRPPPSARASIATATEAGPEPDSPVTASSSSSPRTTTRPTALKISPATSRSSGSRPSAFAMAVAKAEGLEPDDLDVAGEIFSAVGRVVVLGEELLDAVTGLSGSGPASVAVAIEALADGGGRRAGRKGAGE